MWIQYQRFTLRSEDLGASRKVFMRARKASGSGWQVFAASALLEWHTVKTETVRALCFPHRVCTGFAEYGKDGRRDGAASVAIWESQQCDASSVHMRLTSPAPSGRCFADPHWL